MKDFSFWSYLWRFAVLALVIFVVGYLLICVKGALKP